MPYTRLIAALALLVSLAGRASAIVAVDPAADVLAGVRYWEPVAMSSAATNSFDDTGELVELAFSSLGRDFRVKLEPTAMFGPRAKVTWIDSAGTVEEPASAIGQFYMGRLDDDPTSWVRLRITDDGGLAGIISTEDEIYFLQPSVRYLGASGAGASFAYRLSDTESNWQPGSCAARELPSFTRNRSGKKRWPARPSLAAQAAIVAEAATATKRAQLGIVLDYEYFLEHGADSAADVAEIVNAVDGIYQAELGVQMQILNTVVYTESNDPFSSTTDYNALLNELSALNRDNRSPGEMFYNTDLVHLVTNRDLSGTTIGLAWRASLCEPFYGSGLSQDYTSSLYNMTLLLAHEIGHNFGAPHDAQTGSACVSAPKTFIMFPTLSSSLQQKFSDCSKQQIAPELAEASCFDAPGPTATSTPALPTATPTRTPTFGPLTLNAFTAPLVIGANQTLRGTGFTAGSVIQLFVATSSGTVAFGPYTPTSRTTTSLTFSPLPASIALGNGFGTVVVINTDQNYRTSNSQSALLLGSSSANIPSITQIRGVALRPVDIGVPLATVETVVTQGSTVTIAGTGFNAPLVNLFTADGNAGPLTPLPGGSATQIQVVIPSDTPTGPGSFQVVNSPYTGNVLSNAVSVPIGALVSISSVTQSGTTVTIRGTGFSTTSLINLFNGPSGTNIGGLTAQGPRIPLTFISSTELRFQVPRSAVAGSSYVQVLNPPYIAYSSSGSDPDGTFSLRVS
jgi:hypothetical protein